MIFPRSYAGSFHTITPPFFFFFIIIVSEPQVTNTASMRVLPADGLERGPGTAPFRAH